MNKKEEIRKSGQRTLISLTIIGVAVYLGFTPLFELIKGGVAGAFVGSAFGAIFVIVMTMYLLNKQTEIEQESKKSEKLFEEKLKIYWEIFDATELMLEDGCISKEKEMKKLPFVMARLVTIGSDDVIAAYQVVYDEINKVFDEKPDDIVELSDMQKQKLIIEIVEFSNACRVDLGVSSIGLGTDVVKKTTNAIEKSNTLLGRNPPVESDVVDEATIVLSDGSYNLKRHKTGHVRVYKDGNADAESVTKHVLRQINEELNWGFDEDTYFKVKETRTIGKLFIEKIKAL
tara:strand:+ start:262 stop:1125 length:864 start_codon:yes stop_codon:yes gene_type:complete